MPRYFFNISGNRPFQDMSGEELPDDQGAWRAAMKMMLDVESSVTPGDVWRLEVMNADRLVYTVEVITNAPPRSKTG